MVQFYFLSVLFNAISGYILVMESDEADTRIEKTINFSIESGTARLVLGILTMLTGLLKILSVIQGDIPVIGDIIPALVGIAAGFILFFEYYRSKANVDSDKSEKLEQTLVKNRRWVGFAALAAAALHFLFPAVLLL